MIKYIIILVTSLIQISQTYHLNYQAHGFNDLDYFLQIVKKGVNIFKFDVNLAIKQTCLEQTTWQEGDGECEHLMYGLPSCCLVFRGDQSTAPIYNFPSNTTQDFVNIFSSGKYDYIFSKDQALPRYQETKIIALNFQYGPYAVNSLTSTFIYDLFKTINDRNLNIEIIFGRDEFITDYDKLCQETLCSEKYKYISDFPVILQSDAKTLPVLPVPRRFNFNTNYFKIEKFCTEGFPEWINEDNEFPMIFWEPSHEDGMQWTFYKWFNYTCDKPAFKDKLLDYQQANNQEPEMQQVYLQGYNETLYGEKYVYKNKQNPVLEYLEESNLFIMGYQETLFNFSQLTMVDDSQQVLSKISLKQVPQKLKKSRLLDSEDNYILMVIEQTIIQLFQTNVESASLASFPNFFINMPESFLAADILTSEECYIIIMAIIKDDQLYFEFNQITEESQNQLGSQSINVQEYGINVDNIINADFAQIDGKGVLVFNLKNQKSKLYTIFVDFQVTVFKKKLVLKSIDIQMYKQKQNEDELIQNFAFGEKPVIKLYKDDLNEIFFLITTTNAFSQSGVTFNNNDFNKCKYYEYEGFEQLLNLKYAMTYMYGKLGQLIQKVQNNEIITGCSDTIQHASYNNGDNPSIVLKINPNNGIFKKDEYYFTAYVLHEYIDYKELPAPTQLYCGSNGQYLPNTYSETPRPWQEGPIPEIKNSILFEYFSVLPFDVFTHFEDQEQQKIENQQQKKVKQIVE